MKSFFTILFLTFSFYTFAQKTHYNTHKGFIAEGYDVVSYFVNKKPLKGNKKYQTTFDGVKFQFISEKNLQLFKINPKKYVPQYGGYCAYAIGLKSEKVDINPKTFEIRDGKLYLFYNAWGVNTLKMWKNEGAEKLKEKADKNWQKIIKK